MNILLRLFTALCLIVSVPVFAEDGDLSEKESEALQLALDRGLALYNYDQAAWHTTDTMREDVKDLAASGIRGWVTTETGDGFLTTFWRPKGSSYAGAYSAIWNPDGVTDRQILSGDKAVLSAEQIALIRARQTVIGAKMKIERCSKSPFNTVILPPKSQDAPILVYFLVPQANYKAIPMGKHYRFEVKDNKVVSHRSFTNSCIDLQLTSDGAKGKPVALGIAHLLDPVPTEVHIFSAFAARLPIYVSTTSNGFHWSVEISGGVPRVRKVR